MNNFCESCKSDLQQNMNLFESGKSTTLGFICWYLDGKGNTCLNNFSKYLYQPERSKREDSNNCSYMVGCYDTCRCLFRKCSCELKKHNTFIRHFMCNDKNHVESI